MTNASNVSSVTSARSLERWAAGLRYKDHRPLTDGERREVERLRAELLATVRRLSTEFALCATLGVLLGLALGPRLLRPGDEILRPGILLLTGCTFALLGSITLVSFAEAARRTLPLPRALTCGVVGIPLLTVAMVPFAFVREKLLALAIVPAMLAILAMGAIGLFATFARVRELRSSRRLLETLRFDLVAGGVHLYERPGNAGSEWTAELLPTSGLVLAVANQSCITERRTLDVYEIDASAPRDFQAFMEGESDAGATVQRYLTEHESAELARHARRELTQLVSTSGVLLYAAALVAQKLPVVAGAPLGSLPAWLTLCNAVLLCAPFLGPKFRDHSRLRRDRRAATVCSVRRDSPELLNEELPFSGRAWTVNGVPALWRTTRVS